MKERRRAQGAGRKGKIQVRHPATLTAGKLANPPRLVGPSRTVLRQMPLKRGYKLITRE